MSGSTDPFAIRIPPLQTMDLWKGHLQTSVGHSSVRGWEA